MAGMTSNRPYLIRAMYDWILDNNQTPHILVDVSSNMAVVPRQFVQDGHILLNISPTAVRKLTIGNDAIVFSARFSGSLMDIYVPPSTVLGIYAKESGLGMMFPEANPDDQSPESPEAPKSGPTSPNSPVKQSGRPKLTVVK